MDKFIEGKVQETFEWFDKNKEKRFGIVINNQKFLGRKKLEVQKDQEIKLYFYEKGTFSNYTSFELLTKTTNSLQREQEKLTSEEIRSRSITLGQSCNLALKYLLHNSDYTEENFKEKALEFYRVMGEMQKEVIYS